MRALNDCESIRQLREAARRRLPRGVFEYVDRGTEDETLLVENRAALDRIRFIPRYPENIAVRECTTTLFARPSAMPFAIAPTGAAGLISYEGELALARAAAAAGVPYTLATNSVTAVEKIGREVANGRNWMQIYLWRDRELSMDLVDRAANAGFEALMFTMDTPVPPNREYNRRNGFAFPFRMTLRSTVDMLLSPFWLVGTLGRYIVMDGHLPRFENYPEGFRTPLTRSPLGERVQLCDRLSWDDVSRLRERWKGPFIVKGILHPDDAAQAVNRGADGIVVSNHGGRNLDCAIAAIDALPKVVAAVGDRATVLFDSGVRRGSDIAKAIALGARGVMAGRPTLYGAAVAGEAGAAKALAILKHELLTTMANLGVRSLAELGPDRLVRPA
jgi:isopentenyl diphosphate isomerase/L-lactate dehydrogenase-like FMN-dependent dehydrogenase